MPSVHRSESVRPRPSVQPKQLVPRVQANDPAQRVSVAASGQVTIRGKASNRGIVQSFIKLDFDGKSVSLSLHGGENPREVVARLEKSLPRGYALERKAVRTFDDAASFVIVKGSPAKSNVAEIEQTFAKAKKASSTAGDKVSVAELRKAVAVAQQGGLSDDDKAALARSWAALFDGAGYRATPAAQKEYAKLQERLGLPVYPVR